MSLWMRGKLSESGLFLAVTKGWITNEQAIIISQREHE